jgi:hypothetical protein
MLVETETIGDITSTELGFLKVKEADAEKLRMMNDQELEQFTMKFITDEGKYQKTLKMKTDEEMRQEQIDTEKAKFNPLDLDEELKRDLDRIWKELDSLRQREVELWRLVEIVESRREDLLEKRKELEEVKKMFPYLEVVDTTLKRQMSFINWGADGNSGDIEFDFQFERNLWLTKYYLDLRLKLGNLCMKTMAILQIGCEKDSSEGFIEYVAGLYSDFLKTPFTCSKAAVEQLSPVLRKVFEPSDQGFGLQVIQWLLLDTGIGAFLPFKEVTDFLAQIVASQSKLHIEEFGGYLIDHSYWFLQDQIISTVKSYEALRRRLKEEVVFKRKPKQLKQGGPITLNSLSNFKDSQKRLARALAAHDSEAFNSSVQPHTLNQSQSTITNLQKQKLSPTKSAHMLFRITHGGGHKKDKFHDKMDESQSREFSTSVTHNSSKKLGPKDPQHDIGTHTFKVLLNEYHQSIRGSRPS